MTITADGLNQRMMDIETRLSFYEDAQQVFSEQMAHLQEKLEQQQRMLQVVYQQMNDLRELQSDGSSEQNAQEKPPHY